MWICRNTRSFASWRIKGLFTTFFVYFLLSANFFASLKRFIFHLLLLEIIGYLEQIMKIMLRFITANLFWYSKLNLPGFLSEILIHLKKFLKKLGMNSGKMALKLNLRLSAKQIVSMTDLMSHHVIK